MDRRSFLHATAVFNAGLLGGAGASLLVPADATPIAPRGTLQARQLAFVSTHTGDTFSGAYWENGAYVPGALAAINQVMRDHRSGEVHEIDPRLLDQLHTLKRLVEASEPFQIISGYRSPTTNAALRAQSAGVATRSLHMDGRAIDIRVGGVQLTRLRDAALGMQAGGVGFYEASDFIHVDTGRVRHW